MRARAGAALALLGMATARGYDGGNRSRRGTVHRGQPNAVAGTGLGTTFADLEKAVQQVVSNIDELRQALPVQVQKCLAFFAGVDRTVGGYEGLSAAQQCLPNSAVPDKFAAEYCVLGTIWEALSPDPCLSPYQTDYKWLTQVYESVKPPAATANCSGTPLAPRLSS